MNNMYNRYQGNTGRVTRVGNPEMTPIRQFGPPPGPAPVPQDKKKPPNPLNDLTSGIGGLFSKFGGFKLNLGTEDILIALVLYLAYRESGDKELLIILAAMLFF